MAAQGKSAVFAFQFGNEVYSQIAPARYAEDMLLMKALLASAWQELAPGHAVPKLMGPDNGWEDMSAAHLETILAAGGAEAMVAATYHDYQDTCVDEYAANATAAGLVMNASCMDVAMMGAVSRYGPSTAKHGVALWLTEGALHASSGVTGLTNVFASSLWYAHAL